MRLAAKVDRNQQAIVAVYRDKGLLVLSLASMGRGVPDLLVCAYPCLCLVEVKMPGGALTSDQVRFHSLWPVVVVRSPEEAECHAELLLKEATKHHIALRQRAPLPDLPDSVLAYSGYAEVLLQPMQREQPLTGVLPGDGEEGRVTVGGSQTRRREGRAGRKSGPSDPASGVS